MDEWMDIGWSTMIYSDIQSYTHAYIHFRGFSLRAARFQAAACRAKRLLKTTVKSPKNGSDPESRRLMLCLEHGTKDEEVQVTLESKGFHMKMRKVLVPSVDDCRSESTSLFLKRFCLMGGLFMTLMVGRAMGSHWPSRLKSIGSFDPSSPSTSSHPQDQVMRSQGAM